MPTEYFYLKGKTKWFRPVIPDEKFAKWSHVLYPDTESLEIIRSLQAQGAKNQLKKDDDGYYVNIGRPTQIKKSSGIGIQMVGMSPPRIMDKDGKLMDGQINVGNGSDVTTKIEVYEHKTPAGGKAKAMRWAASRIDNLVEFKPERDFDNDRDKKQVEGLADQPEQIF